MSCRLIFKGCRTHKQFRMGRVRPPQLPDSQDTLRNPRTAILASPMGPTARISSLWEDMEIDTLVAEPTSPQSTRKQFNRVRMICRRQAQVSTCNSLPFFLHNSFSALHSNLARRLPLLAPNSRITRVINNNTINSSSSSRSSNRAPCNKCLPRCTSLLSLPRLTVLLNSTANNPQPANLLP